MRFDYEVACREEGLSEEKINKIRQVFDTQKKRLKRINRALDEVEFALVSLSGMNHNSDEPEYFMDIPDESVDVEEEAENNVLLQQLTACLLEMSKRDRELILACFGARGAFTKLREKYGMTKAQVYWRKEKLLCELRGLFGV